MGLLLDSIEPSVSWTNCWPLIDAMRRTWTAEVQRRNMSLDLMIIRISQIYNDGVCVYFYYGIGPTVDSDQLETFEEMTKVLKKEITLRGGSLSHHHGIGKKHAKGYEGAVSKVGLEVFKSIKARLDPNDVFDCGNLTQAKWSGKL